MFEDILGKILNIDEVAPERERSAFGDDEWDTGAGDATWTVFDTPVQEKIWKD